MGRWCLARPPRAPNGAVGRRRQALIRANSARLLRAAAAKRDRVLFDLALDLLIPPLSRIAIFSLLGGLAAALLWACGHRFPISFVAFAWCLFAVVLYVLRGWSLSGTGVRGLLDLGLAPVYVVWKASLRLRKPSRPTSSWVRTKREGPSE